MIYIQRYFVIIIVGYLMGCLQFSYLLTKAIKKVDIRTLGGGNAGASNTVTVFGWKMGVVVALLDILKAIISIFIIKYILKDWSMFDLYLNGFFVILGHNYPFFMNFKGGKGTASTFGMMCAIDYRLGIIAFLLMLGVTIFTDFIAIGAMTLVSLFIIATVYLGFNTSCVIITVLIALQSFYKHIPNLKKILAKEESGLRDALSKKSF